MTDDWPQFDLPTIYKKITPHSDRQLCRQHRWDAGMDIIATESGMIYPVAGRTFQTDLFVAIPPGYVGIIKSRSGLAVKHGIEVGAGVIDAGYRGEVMVKLYNLGTDAYHVYEGDRIAQLLILPVPGVAVMEVEELPGGDDRGKLGFGSTGK